MLKWPGSNSQTSRLERYSDGLANFFYGTDGGLGRMLDVEVRYRRTGGR